MDIDEILSQMTQQEKCAMLAGSDGWHTMGCERLGVPQIMMADGPHGLRKQTDGVDILGFNDSIPVTCFPTASATACSFDESLLERIGQALGEECRAEGVSVLLGPGVNMKRSPLCGRNFEYFSEDPYLAGHMGAAHIRGVQSRGVGCALKHFAGNSQEKARMTSDSVIDDRALHEIYLRAFRIAVQESDPWAVMTAYNRLNGTYCSENRTLMTDILRDHWGWHGLTVTDWEALSSVYASLPAGLDLCMPGPRPDYSEAVDWAVRRKAITRLELDRAVRSILELTDKAQRGAQIPYECDVDAHLALAQEAAERSAVLLKNDGILPLAPNESVAVIGAFAKEPRYQGAGSSRIVPKTLDNFWDAYVEAHEGPLGYAPGYAASSGVATEAQLAEAEALARTHDVAIVFAGLPDSYESEGFDRRSMRMPANQVELIERVCEANPRTVVVLMGGAPFDLDWRHKPAAILLMYLSGCQGGHAAARLIDGAANPSGKLAETWPIERADTPTAGRYPDTHSEILYTESIFIGYRYYDAVGLPVAYPFGFGLSYTTFAYRDLRVEPLPGRDSGCFSVSFTVENTGARDGREIVQLYVAPQDPGVYKAPQTLQRFANVEIPAGTAKRVAFELDRRAFAHYDAQLKSWCVEGGSYEIRISASSRDVRLAQTVDVEGIAKHDDGAPIRYHHPVAGCFQLFDATPRGKRARGALGDFDDLYGRPLPEARPLRPFTIDSSVSDAMHTIYGKVLGGAVYRRMSEMVGTDDENLQRAYAEMLSDMPIKSMHMQGFRMSSAGVVVDVLNRHYVRGLLRWKQAHDKKKRKK